MVAPGKYKIYLSNRLYAIFSRLKSFLVSVICHNDLRFKFIVQISLGFCMKYFKWNLTSTTPLRPYGFFLSVESIDIASDWTSLKCTRQIRLEVLHTKSQWIWAVNMDLHWFILNPTIDLNRYLFYSPSESPTMRGGHTQKLFDYSDTHVLDFEPNLKTLCLMAVIENNLDQTYLPQDIRWA